MLGRHSAVPLPDRNLVIANGAILEGPGDALNWTYVFDVADRHHPKVVSTFPMPTPEPGAPHGRYYDEDGRCGRHDQHHHQGHPSWPCRGTRL